MSGLLEGKRILIADDDVLSMVVFAANLKNQGAYVIQDLFTTETLGLIAHSLPLDLILMDIMLLKGINGYDYFDKIRANRKLARIPIVATTSLDSETEIPKARDKGFDGFLGKPVVSSEIAKHVVRVINGEKIWITGRR